jgi:hypothetical protein
MRMILIAMAMAGCMAGGERAAVQEVAGPSGVTVTVRAEGQLAVSWTADPAAVKYYVYQAAGGGQLAFAASVIGSPPSTSYIATGLSGGVSYCYAIESVYADGSTSDIGAAGCGTATGGAMSTTSTITVPPTSFASSTWSLNVGPNSMQSNTNGILVGGIPSHAGDIVRSLTIPVRGLSGGHVMIAAKVADGTMAETVIGSALVAVTPSWAPAVLDVTDTTIPTGGAVVMIFTADAAGIAVGNIAMRYTPGP